MVLDIGGWSWLEFFPGRFFYFPGVMESFIFSPRDRLY